MIDSEVHPSDGIELRLGIGEAAGKCRGALPKVALVSDHRMESSTARLMREIRTNVECTVLQRRCSVAFECSSSKAAHGK